MGLSKIFFGIIKTYLFVIIVIILAAALRLWPLQSLGGRTVWVTFYPAVMIVALYGGLIPGLVASVLSCCIALFFWQVFVPTPFIKDFGDWLSLAIFMITCTGISITSEAMRRSQKKTREAKEQAEKANKAKSVFLSNMSHELRTPFNAILGFSQIMINDDEATKQQKEYLGIIIRTSEHLLNLINNILDIAKIESGQIHLEEKDTNLFQFIEEIQSLMAVKATEKGLSFNVSKSNDLPVHILADAGKLRQVLINLIGNGIKFTSKGSIALHVNMAESRTDDHILLRFEVHDTGLGISEADKARIFQSFVQLENKNTTEAGTGLGLAISKQYIELMGGSIQIDGTPGQGSVFYFEISVRILESEDSDELRQLHQRAKLKEGQPEYTILIVEDQFENRLLLHTLLESAGFKVLEAFNGKEAIDICHEYLPDLVFMDMRMPVMGGTEATKLIKSEPGLAQIKIVALTAHALEDERREMFNAGCDDFIRKPYHDSEIFDSIAKLLNVQYVYSTADNEHINTGTVDRKELIAVPEDIKQELLKAAILLDYDACIAIIEEITSSHQHAATYLKKLVSNMDFQKLIVLLEPNNTNHDDNN